MYIDIMIPRMMDICFLIRTKATMRSWQTGKGWLEPRLQRNVPAHNAAELPLDCFRLHIPVASDGCARDEAHGLVAGGIEGILQFVWRAGIVNVGAQISLSEENDEGSRAGDGAAAVGESLAFVQVHGHGSR